MRFYKIFVIMMISMLLLSCSNEVDYIKVVPISTANTIVPTSDIENTTSQRSEITTIVLQPQISQTDKAETTAESPQITPSTTSQTVSVDPPTTTIVDTYKVTITEFTSNVKRGNKAVVTIQGIPNHTYTLKVKYSSGYSNAAGLGEVESDENGVCTWSWRVGASTAVGTYPVTISDGVNEYVLNITIT